MDTGVVKKINIKIFNLEDTLTKLTGY